MYENILLITPYFTTKNLHNYCDELLSTNYWDKQLKMSLFHKTIQLTHRQ